MAKEKPKSQVWTRVSLPGKGVKPVLLPRRRQAGKAIREVADRTLAEIIELTKIMKADYADFKVELVHAPDGKGRARRIRTVKENGLRE